MQASDLWSARFFAVAEYAEDYRRFFNVHVPAWFSDESKRSKSREQYRGIDGEAAKHRVRRWLNCQAILAAAKANGFSLGDLGLYLPHDLVNAQAEVEQWRAVEAERSARRRAQKKQDRNEATAEVESIPSEVEVLRQKLIESEAEKQALQRENTRLRSQANHMDAYRQAKHAVMSDAVDSNMFNRSQRGTATYDLSKVRLTFLPPEPTSRGTVLDVGDINAQHLLLRYFRIKRVLMTELWRLKN